MIVVVSFRLAFLCSLSILPGACFAQENGKLRIETGWYTAIGFGQDRIYYADRTLKVASFDENVNGLFASFGIKTKELRFGLRLGGEYFKNGVVGVGIAELNIDLREQQSFNRMTIGVGRSFGTIQNEIDQYARLAALLGLRCVEFGKHREWALDIESRLQAMKIYLPLQYDSSGNALPEETTIADYFSIGFTLSRRLR